MGDIHSLLEADDWDIEIGLSVLTVVKIHYSCRAMKEKHLNFKNLLKRKLVRPMS
jgi:hypothetical protein